MADFIPAYPDTLDLDPGKRVFYSHGLVLGVDEFVQEELYLLEKQRRHNRGLHGYGTVCGLRLEVGDDGGQPELVVGPGLALDPAGREVRVPETQCARLNDWLLRHHDEAVAVLGSPPAGSPALLTLSLVLCYAECQTDSVPVPSGPCQSLDRTMVPSRLADDFRLEFRADPDFPAQEEEQAIRELAALLNGIEVSGAPGGLREEDLIELVRSLLPGGSPASPPLPAGHIHPADAAELRRTAFRIWVTEVRPGLLEERSNCEAGPPAAGCILLGRVEFPVEDTALGLRVAGSVRIDESDRPYLLSTRLLQELLGVGSGVTAGGGGGGVDLMHLTGAETVTGSKTFTAPLLLSGAGRVRKQIDLPASSATVTQLSTTRILSARSLPAVRFSPSGGPDEYQGTALFPLGLPDDIDPTEPMRARLFWFFDVLPPAGSPPPAPAPSYDFHWELRNRWFALGDHLPQTLLAAPAAVFAGTVNLADEFDLLATDFDLLPAAPIAGALLGALHVNVGWFDPPNARLYLVKVELDYVANRLGRALP